MVFQLFYHSRFMPVGAGPSSAIRSILRASQENNFRDGITGFLIFDKSSFVQVLEGDHAAVHETYERIGDDPRHAQLTLIATRLVAERAFPDWTMGGHLRGEDTRDIYLRHGVAGGLGPQTLTADGILALAGDLGAFEAARRQQRILGAA